RRARCCARRARLRRRFLRAHCGVERGEANAAWEHFRPRALTGALKDARELRWRRDARLAQSRDWIAQQESRVLPVARYPRLNPLPMRREERAELSRAAVVVSFVGLVVRP